MEKVRTDGMQVNEVEIDMTTQKLTVDAEYSTK